MKELLSGNEAIARGAYEAGCKVIASYPGTPSTEINETLSKYEGIYSEWSINEKVAFEIAAGSALCGLRSITSMKHVGVNVAADSLFNMVYEGVNAGLVIVSADDPGIHSSQNEQDNRLYAEHAKVPLLEPSSSQECKEFVKLAFEISEKFDVPVLLRITSRIAHSKSIVEIKEKTDYVSKEYIKDANKRILVPSVSRVRHEVIEKNIIKLREYSNEIEINTIEFNSTEVGIITSGICYNYVKEVFGDDISILKLAMTYPMPDQKIKEFSQKVKTLYIIEENEPYIERYVKQIVGKGIGKAIIPICGELTPTKLYEIFNLKHVDGKQSSSFNIPQRNLEFCAGCSHRAIYTVLREYDNLIVSGDIGCYTIGGGVPFNSIDTVLCMGASIGLGTGMQLAEKIKGTNKRIVSVIGDSTFFHSGITALINSIYNNNNVVLVILDNSSTAMTGNQYNPGVDIIDERTCKKSITIYNVILALGVNKENITVIEDYNLKKIRAALDKSLEKCELSVVIVKKECMKNQANTNNKKRCKISRAKCKNCGKCLSIACPAIEKSNIEIKINESLCNGCGVCLQVCDFYAIEFEVENE